MPAIIIPQFAHLLSSLCAISLALCSLTQTLSFFFQCMNYAVSGITSEDDAKVQCSQECTKHGLMYFGGWKQGSDACQCCNTKQ